MNNITKWMMSASSDALWWWTEDFQCGCCPARHYCDDAIKEAHEKCGLPVECHKVFLNWALEEVTE